MGHFHEKVFGFVQVALLEGDPHGQHVMAGQSVVSFPTKGQGTTLLMPNVGGVGGSNDTGNQSPKGEEGTTHGERKLLGFTWC